MSLSSPKRWDKGASARYPLTLTFHCPIQGVFYPDVPVSHFSFLSQFMKSTQHLPHQKTATVPGPPCFAVSTTPAWGGLSITKPKISALPCTPEQGLVAVLAAWCNCGALHRGQTRLCPKDCIPEVNGLSAVCSHPECCSLSPVSITWNTLATFL